MKYTIAIAAFLGLLVYGCIGRTDIREKQSALHEAVTASMGKTLERTEKEVTRSTQAVVEEYVKANCPPPKPSKTSSVYLPKSVKTGKRLDCILNASHKLDATWSRLNDANDFYSWLYLYDSDSRALRIYPATNPKSLFGEDLVFDQFFFFKGAVTSYPKGSWTRVRPDINGTGKIIVYTQAFKLPGSETYATVSADLRSEALLRHEQERLIEAARTGGMEHLFVYGYQKDGDTRVVAHDFSSDPTKWRMLKSFSGTTLHLNYAEAASLAELEAQAEKKAGRAVRGNLSLDGVAHYCTIVWIENILLYSVMCSEN